MDFREVKDTRRSYFYRVIMESFIGRKLRKEEIVHHIDGDSTNNSANNLMIFPSIKEHTQFHYHKEREKLISSGVYKYPNQLQTEWYEKNKHIISRRELLKRMKYDDGEYICEECGRHFKNKKSLSNHTRWHKGFWRVK